MLRLAPVRECQRLAAPDRFDLRNEFDTQWQLCEQPAVTRDDESNQSFISDIEFDASREGHRHQPMRVVRVTTRHRHTELTGELVARDGGDVSTGMLDFDVEFLRNTDVDRGEVSAHCDMHLQFAGHRRDSDQRDSQPVGIEDCSI